MKLADNKIFLITKNWIKKILDKKYLSNKSFLRNLHGIDENNNEVWIWLSEIGLVKINNDSILFNKEKFSSFFKDEKGISDNKFTSPFCSNFIKIPNGNFFIEIGHTKSEMVLGVGEIMN